MSAAGRAWIPSGLMIVASATIAPAREIGYGVGCRSLCLAQLSRLRVQSFLGIPSHIIKCGTAGRRDDSGEDALDERSRNQPGLDARVGHQINSQLRAQDCGTQIHDHHDAGTVIGSDNGFCYPRRIGAKPIIRRASCDLDAWSRTMHHLQRQLDGRMGQAGAVGDNNDPHHLAQRPSSAERASKSRDMEAAPGSICPALRSPK